MRFNYYLRKCIIFEIEPWGMLDDIFIMLSKDFKRITIQTENLKVIRVLQGSVMTDSEITVFRRVQRIIRTEE